jgi:hypothetical protein
MRERGEILIRLHCFLYFPYYRCATLFVILLFLHPPAVHISHCVAYDEIPIFIAWSGRCFVFWFCLRGGGDQPWKQLGLFDLSLTTSEDWFGVYCLG